MKYRTRVWKPFDRENYHWAWKDGNVLGIIKEFCRDMRRCHERIWKGYCDYDTFSIFDWFLGLMPTMLEDFRDHTDGYPSRLDSERQNPALDDSQKDKAGMQAWKDVLDKMIFLMKETDEATCSRENPFEEEYRKAQKDFERKYGPFGEKLLTEEERKDHIGTRVYFPSDVEEYKPISDQYFEELKKIHAYRHECKDQALALFSECFFDLWD